MKRTRNPGHAALPPDARQVSDLPKRSDEFPKVYDL
jgi:hypothetical protein